MDKKINPLAIIVFIGFGVVGGFLSLDAILMRTDTVNAQIYSQLVLISGIICLGVSGIVASMGFKS